MNRIRQVARLQIPAWPHILGWTWSMMAVTFGINLLSVMANYDPGDGVTTTGGVASLYGIAIGMATISVTQIFPYALGMSVTRREFYLAWSLLAVVQSVVYALVLCLLRAVGDWSSNQRPIACHCRVHVISAAASPSAVNARVRLARTPVVPQRRYNVPSRIPRWVTTSMGTAYPSRSSTGLASSMNGRPK
jgi:hypothetical protein